MKKYIQAKSGSNIKKFLNSLFNGLDKLMNFNTMKPKESKDIEAVVKGKTRPGKEFLYDVNGENGLVTLEVYLFAIEDHENKFLLKIQAEGYEPYEKGPVDREDVETYVLNYADKYNLGTNIEEYIDVNGSRKLQVNLQKVITADSVDIKLNAINANYNPAYAVCDLDTILSDESFIEQIEESPTCYEIMDTGNVYDVTSIDKIDMSDVCGNIIGMAVKLWCDMSVIYWNASGAQCNKLREFILDIRYSINDDIEFFGELSVELGDKVYNPGVYLTNETSHIVGSEDGFTYEFGIELISNLLKPYVSVLEFYYVNFSPDVQTILSNKIRNYNRLLNYNIKQQSK